MNLKPANWDSLPGPDDIHLAELPNGLTVLTRSNFSSQSVVISGYLPAGSVFDPEDRLGLAYFTAVSLMRGTAERSFQDIYNCLEDVGASLSIGAGMHTASFGGRSLTEDLPLLLGLLSDALRQPTFPEVYVERLRSQMLAAIAIREEDTGDMASITFDQLLFAGHPYAHPEDGYRETVQRISRDDLRAFHRTHYGPRGMVLAVVGAVEPQQVFDLAEKAFGGWQNPAQVDAPRLPPLRPLTETVRKHVFIPGKSQTNLVMGTFGPKRTSEDHLVASIGNNIFGQFGMMGRIGDVVREQSGLAYHASASLNAWIDAGSWEVSAGVNPANLEKTIALIKDEIRRLISEPVSQEELEDSQSHYIGRLPLSLESNAGVAAALLKMHRFNLGLDYYKRFPALVSQITAEQVLEVARRYLDPEKLVIVSAGPETTPAGGVQ